MSLSFRQLGNTFIQGQNIIIYPSGNSYVISKPDQQSYGATGIGVAGIDNFPPSPIYVLPIDILQNLSGPNATMTFKSFSAGTGIGIIDSNNTLIFTAFTPTVNGLTSFTSAGTGNRLLLSTEITSNTLFYKSFSAGAGIGIIDSNNTLIFTASSIGGTIISGVNASTGVNIFTGLTTINNSNDALAFFTLSASGDTSISLNSNNEIVVDRGVNITNTLTNLGGGARIFSAITGNSLVQMTIISAATNSGFTASASSPLKPDAGADSDATSFITAASISNQTHITAIQNLVFDLKENNIWNKMQAIYPFVGGNATSHTYNLKDPRNLDAAFRLSFTTGWTHNASGATPNGTSAYADTFYNLLSSATQNSHHISYYSRTNSTGPEIEIGAVEGTNGFPSASRSFIEIRTVGTSYFAINIDGDKFLSFIDANSIGFYVANRTSANNFNAWKNGARSAFTTTTPASKTPPNRKYFLGAYNNNNTGPANFSTKQCAFASIGSGLTDSDIATYYTIVEAYQTTLGRQIVASTLRSLGTNTRLDISPSNTTADRFYITTTGPVLNINANYTTLAASSTMSIGGTAVATTRLLLAAGTGAISQIRLTPFATEPTNPSDGSIWYSTSGNTLKLERGTNPSDFLFVDNNISLAGYPSALIVDTAGTITREYLNSFGIFNTLSSVTIQNTTSELSLISTILTGSTTLLSSTNLYNPELIVGRKFRFNAKGSIQTDNSDVDNLEIKIKISSTTIGTTNAFTVFKGISANTYFEIDTTITIRNSGLVICSGKLIGDAPIVNITNSDFRGIYNQNATITTTSDQILDCTAQFNQANNNNRIIINESTLEILN